MRIWLKKQSIFVDLAKALIILYLQIVIIFVNKQNIWLKK